MTSVRDRDLLTDIFYRTPFLEYIWGMRRDRLLFDSQLANRLYLFIKGVLATSYNPDPDLYTASQSSRYYFEWISSAEDIDSRYIYLSTEEISEFEDIVSISKITYFVLEEMIAITGEMIYRSLTERNIPSIHPAKFNDLVGLMRDYLIQPNVQDVILNLPEAQEREDQIADFVKDAVYLMSLGNPKAFANTYRKYREAIPVASFIALDIIENRINEDLLTNPYRRPPSSVDIIEWVNSICSLWNLACLSASHSLTRGSAVMIHLGSIYSEPNSRCDFQSMSSIMIYDMLKEPQEIFKLIKRSLPNTIISFHSRINADIKTHIEKMNASIKSLKDDISTNHEIDAVALAYTQNTLNLYSSLLDLFKEFVISPHELLIQHLKPLLQIKKDLAAHLYSSLSALKVAPQPTDFLVHFKNVFSTLEEMEAVLVICNIKYLASFSGPMILAWLHKFARNQEYPQYLESLYSEINERLENEMASTESKINELSPIKALILEAQIKPFPTLVRICEEYDYFSLSLASYLLKNISDLISMRELLEERTRLQKQCLTECPSFYWKKIYYKLKKILPSHHLEHLTFQATFAYLLVNQDYYPQLHIYLPIEMRTNLKNSCMFTLEALNERPSTYLYERLTAHSMALSKKRSSQFLFYQQYYKTLLWATPGTLSTFQDQKKDEQDPLNQDSLDVSQKPLASEKILL